MAQDDQLVAAPRQAVADDGRVSAHWDSLASEEFIKDFSRRSWTGIPEIHLNHNARVTGDRNIYWVTWLRERYFPTGFAGDTLSLGCGEGHLDRILKNCGLTFRSFTGVDISPKAIERAQSLGEESGSRAQPSLHGARPERRTDTDRVHSTSSIFSSRFTTSSNWKSSWSSARSSWLRTGSLMVNEFVGPTRFQWTERQKTMADAIINLLPTRYAPTCSTRWPVEKGGRCPDAGRDEVRRRSVRGSTFG